MTLTEQIYTQALLLAGPLDRRQDALLKMLCQSVQRGLEKRLRGGIMVSDCQSDFVCAACLLALAALSETDELGMGASFSVGDISVKRGDGKSAANCLRRQALLVMAPYLRDEFAFLGV